MRTAIFNCPYLGAPGAIRWIVGAWSEGFRRRGYQFHTCEDAKNLAAKCEAFRPSILLCDIVTTPIEDPSFRHLLARLRKQGTKVCLSVYWPMTDQPNARIEALKLYDVADLYYGEREFDSMLDFCSFTGKKFFTIPQSANPAFHKPTNFNPNFAYDVVFVGARLPLKHWFNKNIISRLNKKGYRVGIFGSGWTFRDNSLRLISKGARFIDMRPIASFIDKFRITLTETDEVSLYSSSKISLNFHERQPNLSQPHHLVNQRTFKIAACGGFQILDPVIALPKYFSSDEIVTADFRSEDWFDKIDFYLTHEQERKAILMRATARAQNEHMAQHRVDLLERLIGSLP